MMRLARTWSHPPLTLVAVLTALVSVVDIGTKALYEQLSRIRTSSRWESAVWALRCQAGVIGTSSVLEQKRATLVKEGTALLENADASAEDRTRGREILGKVKEIDADLVLIEGSRSTERTAPAQTRAPAVVTDRSDADPKRAFGNMADFAMAVYGACRPGAAMATVDPRLAALGQPVMQAAPTNYHEEGHSNDGYMVPPEFRQEIWRLVFEDDDLLSQVNPEPTSSNAVTGLADESTPWGATGIKAYWTAEGALKTTSRLDTDSRTVRLHKLAALVTASDELLEDAPRLNARLTVGAARAITWVASDAIMWGTGVGQPLGWMNAPAKIVVAKETGQVANTINPTNITKMFSRILGGPGARLAWKANRDITPQLVDLRVGNEPSWIGSNGGLRDAPSGMLMGVPMHFSEHPHTLGTEGDLQLVNLSGYYATTKSGGLKFDQSIHLYFDYDITAFRWVFRVGGMPFLSAPVTPARGTTTKSHFVALATRA